VLDIAPPTERNTVIESRSHVDVLPETALLPDPLSDRQEGFTLLELVVAVFIIGILLAIAIPTFLGLTGGAKKSAAEADLTTAVQDESIYFSGMGASTNYGIATAAGATTGMAAIDNGISWVTTTGTATVPVSAAMQASTKTVGVLTASPLAGPLVLLDTLGKDGTYYWAQIQNGVVKYTTTTSPTPASVTFAATTLP
jgi:prepilin-type N-terminal cleavage/methylation domain-containing protein